MKRIISLITALTILLTLALTVTGCKKEEPAPEQMTPEQVYTILYEWLLENGKLEEGTKLIYWYQLEQKSICVKYDSAFDGSIHFTMYFPDYKSYELKLTYTISKESTDDKQTYTVYLDSKTNRAYSFNSYSYDKEIFAKNSPVSSKSTVNSNNTGSFPTPYTEEEKQEGRKLSSMITDIHYDCLLTFLDWLSTDFCSDVGITLSDLGYKKYK